MDLTQTRKITRVRMVVVHTMDNPKPLATKATNGVTDGTTKMITTKIRGTMSMESLSLVAGLQVGVEEPRALVCLLKEI
jgi:hypothetical protein